MNGLPAAARQRIDRQASSGVRSSLFSAPATAAALSAGLVPVGEVFGCLVMNLGWSGSGCGWYGPLSYSSTSLSGGFAQPASSPVVTSGRGGRYSGMSPYVRAIEAAWAGALQRMLAEAKALGAHGVVGIRIERKPIDNQAWEFTALGTAVRSTDPVVAPHLPDGGVWSTDLSAEDTASAILSGFIPHEILLGLSVATNHEDWLLRTQRMGWDNQEVEGMTMLIQAARHEARARLESRASHSGGAQLVVTQVDLYEFETACSGEAHDFHAEAMFVGTTLTQVPRFRTPATSHVLTVLPLRDSARF